MARGALRRGRWAMTTLAPRASMSAIMASEFEGLNGDQRREEEEPVDEQRKADRAPRGHRPRRPSCWRRTRNPWPRLGAAACMFRCLPDGPGARASTAGPTPMLSRLFQSISIAALNLIQIDLDVPAAMRATSLPHTQRHNADLLLKTVLTEAFAGHVVRPWTVRHQRGPVVTVLGYAALGAEELRTRLSMALPALHQAILAISGHELVVPTGSVRFSVRLCPTVHDYARTKRQCSSPPRARGFTARI